MTPEAILGRLAGSARPAHPDAPPPDVPAWKPEPPLEPVEKPDHPYGYRLAGGETRLCSRIELTSQVTENPGVAAVWTPETEGALAHPEDVPWLLAEVRRNVREKARAGAINYTIITVLLAGVTGVALWQWGLGAFRSLFYLFAVLAAMEAVSHAARLRATGGFGAADFTREREEARYTLWLRGRPATISTWLAGCMVAVTVVAFIPDDRAVAVAGLVKDRVWEEPFRLVTAAVLHVQVFHLWMNALALYYLGRLMEAHASPPRLPLVFLLSALGGSLASAVLHPGASVGASGGILGLVGYMVVLTHRRAHEFPRGYLRRMGLVVGGTALLGALGFAIIDNAAHAGGFVAGLLLGRVLVSAEPNPEPEPAWLRAAGWISMVIVAAAAAMTIILIISDPLGSAAGL